MLASSLRKEVVFLLLYLSCSYLHVAKSESRRLQGYDTGKPVQPREMYKKGRKHGCLFQSGNHSLFPRQEFGAKCVKNVKGERENMVAYFRAGITHSSRGKSLVLNV